MLHLYTRCTHAALMQPTNPLGETLQLMHSANTLQLMHLAYALG